MKTWGKKRHLLLEGSWELSAYLDMAGTNISNPQGKDLDSELTFQNQRQGPGNRECWLSAPHAMCLLPSSSKGLGGCWAVLATTSQKAWDSMLGLSWALPEDARPWAPRWCLCTCTCVITALRAASPLYTPQSQDQGAVAGQPPWLHGHWPQPHLRTCRLGHPDVPFGMFLQEQVAQEA